MNANGTGAAAVLAARQNRSLIEYATDHGNVKLSPEIVRKYLVSGRPEAVTDTEIVMFMQLCRYQGLNPFLREAYLIKYSHEEPATMVTGKDTFTKRASKIQECEGYNAGVMVLTPQGEVEKRKGSMVIEGETLVGGWAEVYRKSWKEPIEISVSLAEYVRKRKDGTPNKQWATMPATMIRKVALVQALREAFPDNYQGLYSPEEMPVDPSSLPTNTVEPPKAEPPEQEPTLDAASQAAAEKGFELGTPPAEPEPPQPQTKTANGPKVPPAAGKKTVAEMFSHQKTPATKRTVDPETGELAEADPKAEALDLY